jgi:hypothetical protein
MSVDNLETLSRHEAEFRAWLSAWYDHAFKIGLIRPPFTLDNATALRLEGYFNVGLTPAEGASVIFGVVH